MNGRKICIIFICCSAIIALMLTGCTTYKNTDAGVLRDTSDKVTAVNTSSLYTASMFSDSDVNSEYDGGYEIMLSDNNIESTCDTLLISDSTVTVKDEGTYIISGQLSDGQIIVDAEKTDKIQLVLKGVDITSTCSAPIYVRQADKVFITLEQASDNYLRVTGNYVAIDENNIDSAIFSKEDLTLNGKGSLEISAQYGHGIVSKDELAICGGVITITSQKHALSGKDNVKISDSTLNLSSGKDGIHSENTDDQTLGYVYIASGNINIESGGDGIDAQTTLQIDGGNISIKSGGGASNGEQKTDDFFGRGFGEYKTDLESGTDTDTDTVSTKGIKGSGNVIINGGVISIDSADDSVHSNGDIKISAGQLDLSTGDDGIHADMSVLITSADILVRESYEGIEGLAIDVQGENIDITSSDDGMNAAGGNDQSGFGGGPGHEISSDDDIYIKISGGNIKIDAGGDGIDSNGDLYIAGGETFVEGPENSGNGALDYNGSAEISSGNFIATCASGMEQGFTGESTQGSILVIVSNTMVNGTIALLDSSSNEILSYTPSKSYNSVLISCKDIKKGGTYILTSGGTTQTIEMEDIIYDGSGSANGGFGGKGDMPSNRDPGMQPGDRRSAMNQMF